jgi:hypothetical protein
LFVGSILGPGNIFLMLVEACEAAFKIDYWNCFLYNIVPILIYMTVCFFCKKETQVRYINGSRIPLEFFINVTFYKSTLGQLLMSTAVLLTKFLPQRKSLKI